MVQIPNDIGLRMRLQAEAQLLQPAAPVSEIATDFPELRQGQRFTARILEALPENSYKALVAGKSLTLSLPESARPGDSLDLVVIDRSTKAVIAQLAPTQPKAGAEGTAAYPYANLSTTGKLVAALLPEEGQTSAPVPLSRSGPLTTSPPTQGAQALASALATSVQSSGIFYESHQAQWLLGSYPLGQLLDEPQAQFSNFTTLVHRLLQPSQVALPQAPAEGQPQSAPAANAVTPAAPEIAQVPKSEVTVALSLAPAFVETSRVPQNEVATVQAEPATVAARTAVPTADSNLELTGELKALVQQQLDIGANQRLVMHGEVWPRQVLQWEVERDARHSGPAEERDPNWTTRLALSMPSLGDIGAQIQITPNGARLALIAGSPATAERMRSANGRLLDAMAAAGIPVLGITIGETKDPMPPDPVKANE